MMVRLKTDVYEIIRSLNEDGLRELAFNLVDKWGHPQSCAALAVSSPVDGKVLVGSSGEDCDCGAEDRMAEAIEPVWMTHKFRKE